jgi:hypothetical protein
MRHYASLLHATLAASLIVVVITAAALAGPREDIKEAHTAYRRGDDATAFRIVRQLAKQGVAAGQALFGAMYAEGAGVTQNYGEAMKWYRKAADQGLAGAQALLGAMYAEGTAVPQNYGEAMKWYRKAAHQGEAFAQASLGFMYEHGKGVTQNYGEALRWYRKAAEQGNADAQILLGAMYAEGRGVPQNYVNASLWFNLSAAQGNSLAKKYGDSIAERMNPAQIAAAQKLTHEWKAGAGTVSLHVHQPHRRHHQNVLRGHLIPGSRPGALETGLSSRAR